jgi:hypothetical protein
VVSISVATVQDGLQKKTLVLLYKERRMREQKAFPGVLFDLSAPECRKKNGHSLSCVVKFSKMIV